MANHGKKSRLAPNNPKCTAGVRIKDADGEYVVDADGKFAKRPCSNHAITGGTVCWTHGGRAPHVRARAAVVAEVARWGPGDSKIDPGEVMLRLVSQSFARVTGYSAKLETLVEENGGDLQAAMVGDSLVLDREGREIKVGEYIRGLAKLEAEERDRCATFSAKAIAAGLAERQVRLAEKQVEIMAAALDAALEAAGVPVAERGPAKLAAARHLRAV